MDLTALSPRGLRQLCRDGSFCAPTSGLCPGYAQANLIILPREDAYDFLLFAQRNPKACPLLEVTDTGSRETRFAAKDCDLARDFPLYRVYRDGVLEGEYPSVESFWRDDLVSFLIGCSFSFESELIEAGIEMRHNTMGCNVPMYLTSIDTVPAGRFSGKMVCSMRPIPYGQVVRAVTVTAALPRVHGSPIHIGDPSVIGVHDLSHPDFGDSVEVYPGEVPVFWPCGVTPQSVVMTTKPGFAITHAPGYMLVTDLKNADLRKD